MCLALPAKVISVDGALAVVRIEDTEYTANMMMLEDVTPGEYVMLHAGFAIHKVDEDEALETIRLLNEVARYDPSQTDEIR